LEWDEYVVGDNLQLENFTISVTDMVWVPGEGYQSNSPGSFQIVMGNYRVMNQKKNIAYRFKVTPGDKPLEDIEDVVVEAVWSGDGTTDDWSIGGGAIESIKFSYTYEEQQDGSFVLMTDGWVQPQPWKVRFTVQTKGSGTGPKIQKVWSGEKCVPIPEPCTLLLTGIGLGFCHRLRRARRLDAKQS
ncbi:MAG: hypothetical protein JW810_05815, partial [Sedimentisphaerales bacterium]|nr:hypothetical protein [Sedimentisphaerales bacterium]